MREDMAQREVWSGGRVDFANPSIDAVRAAAHGVDWGQSKTYSAGRQERRPLQGSFVWSWKAKGGGWTRIGGT